LNYFYRGIHDFALATKSFGDEALFKKIYAFSKEFALNSGQAEHLTENL